MELAECVSGTNSVEQEIDKRELIKATSAPATDSSEENLPNTDIQDVSVDEHISYMEAVDSDALTKDTSEFFGGSYTADNGSFVIVLTEDTPENRAQICKELGNAMSSRELPFVISSGVYETINKIKVQVTTNEEAELAKLKALDTIGGAIEIEYTSGNDISTLDVLKIETKNAIPY